MQIKRLIFTCAALSLFLLALSGCNVIVGGNLSYSYGTYWRDDDSYRRNHHRPPPSVKPDRPQIQPPKTKPARPDRPRPNTRPAKRR